MTALEKELLASLKECVTALAAAMRVIADLDTPHLMGMDSDTRQQRFVDEMHLSGVRDGVGVRAHAVIDKAERQ